MLSLFLLSCTNSSLPQGVWGLYGIDMEGIGQISIHKHRVSVELYTERLTTDGEVQAQVDQQEELLWLFFPLRTGQGGGEAALRFQGEEAMIPLGARRGEFEVYFSAKKDALSPDLSDWKNRSMNAVNQERAYWEKGEFLLQVEDNLLGVWKENMLTVFDRHWLTPSAVPVEPKMEGADLILTFPVEPSFHNEQGSLRINVPLRKVSVPISDQMDPLDRQMSLIPGSIAQEDIERRMQKAISDADKQEEMFVLDLIQNTFSSGSCEKLVTLDLNSLPVWKGYKLEWQYLSGDNCALSIEPTPIQHRRRLQRIFKKNDI